MAAQLLVCGLACMTFAHFVVGAQPSISAAYIPMLILGAAMFIAGFAIWPKREG